MTSCMKNINGGEDWIMRLPFNVWTKKQEVEENIKTGKFVLFVMLLKMHVCECLSSNISELWRVHV